LNADATALTCIANDWNFEAVFSRQVEAHGRPGDLLVAFTTSGKSPNIAAALQTARRSGMKTLLLTGKTGGTCLALADQAVVVPSDNTARIQEIHGWILHVLLEAVETLPAA
jgi:D-sedoheptulose 7-phosphate isomerase